MKDSTTVSLGQLSALDRYLPVWIGLAMAAGLVLGRLVPGMKAAFQVLQIDTVSLPIALGLLWMMYPVLAKVKYEELPKAFREWKVFSLALALNWAVAPPGDRANPAQVHEWQHEVPGHRANQADD